jgi:hypothetical protein
MVVIGQLVVSTDEPLWREPAIAKEPAITHDAP